MAIEIAGVSFHYYDYDERGDTLHLSTCLPRDEAPAKALETPEGHVVEYDESGAVVALELLNVRWALQREGEVRLTCPEEHHVSSAALQSAIAAA